MEIEETVPPVHATSVVKKDIGREIAPMGAVPISALAEQVATTAAKTVTSHASAPIPFEVEDVALVVVVAELATTVVKKDTLRKNARIRNRTEVLEEETVTAATIVERKVTYPGIVLIHRRKPLVLEKIGPRFNAATAVNVS